MIGDFTRWNDRLVFSCDDSAKRFLNKRKAKGNIGGPGQSSLQPLVCIIEQAR